MSIQSSILWDLNCQENYKVSEFTCSWATLKLCFNVHSVLPACFINIFQNNLNFAISCTNASNRFYFTYNGSAVTIPNSKTVSAGQAYICLHQSSAGLPSIITSLM